MAIGFGVLAGLVLVLLVAGYAWVRSESTDCFGMFPSERAAAAAAEDVGGASDPEPRDGRWAVTFSTGETGADAAGFRRDFARAVREHGGELGHPGNGCLERTPFM